MLIDHGFAGNPVLKNSVVVIDVEHAVIHPAGTKGQPSTVMKLGERPQGTTLRLRGKIFGNLPVGLLPCADAGYA